MAIGAFSEAISKSQLLAPKLLASATARPPPAPPVVRGHGHEKPDSVLNCCILLIIQLDNVVFVPEAWR